MSDHLDVAHAKRRALSSFSPAFFSALPLIPPSAACLVHIVFKQRGKKRIPRPVRSRMRRRVWEGAKPNPRGGTSPARVAFGPPLPSSIYALFASETEARFTRIPCRRSPPPLPAAALAALVVYSPAGRGGRRGRVNRP